MSTLPVHSVYAATASTDVELRSWPLVDDRRRSIVLAAAVVGVAGVVFLATGKWPLAVLAAAAMGVAVWRTFVPVWFQFGAAGVTQRVFRTQRRIPWPAIGCYQVRSHGLLLLPDEQPTGVDMLRGLFIPYGGQRDRLIEVFRKYAVYAREVASP